MQETNKWLNEHIYEHKNYSYTCKNIKQTSQQSNNQSNKQKARKGQKIMKQIKNTNYKQKQAMQWKNKYTCNIGAHSCI